MTPSEFVRSAEWKHIRDEVWLEMLAVCLPILIYAVGLGAAQYGLKQYLQPGTDGGADLAHLMLVPDALFGGCILFAFAAIQGYRYRDLNRNASHAAHDGICNWRAASLGGLIVCALLSGLAVIFHPVWALPVGITSIYAGGLAYKKVVFLRAYLESLSTSEGSAPVH